MPLPKTTPARIQIQEVAPQVDCGRYPVKRTVGDDGRGDRADLPRRPRDARRGGPPPGLGATRWSETPLEPLGNDRLGRLVRGRPAGALELPDRGLGRPRRLVPQELRRKVAAGQADLTGELSEGAALLGEEELTVEQALAAPTGDRSEQARSATYSVDVDRELARFGAWYELFPRSWGGFAGVRELLPRFAELGFDVLYLPPIHPIGQTNRKGRNNAEPAEPGDVGSPWAIGADEGGHDGDRPGSRHRAGTSHARRRRAEARDRDRARLRDPVLARPSLAAASIPSGSTAAPTGR